MKRLIFLIVLILGNGLLIAQPTKGQLRVKVGHFMQTKGNLVVMLYDSLSRLKGKGTPILTKTVPITADQEEVVFEIPAGRYGVSAFHDVDGNGTLEFENEDYGLSNGAVARYGPPKFKQMSFYFDGTSQQIFVSLENERANKSAHYSGKRVATPVIGYAPETSAVLGANLINFFRLAHSDTVSRTSFIDIFSAVTLREQIIAETEYTLFSNHEKYMVIGQIGFQKFPQYYYGIGNYVPDSNKELIRYNQITFEQLFLRNIYKKLYAGIGYHYDNVFDLQDGTMQLLENSRVPGYSGAVVSGIKFCVTSDSRNNIYNTSRGHLVRVKYGVNNSAVGSRYDFTSLETDVRGFLKLGPQSEDILALQVYTYFTTGTVPWFEMGTLGSDMIMRGYYSGRFRDRNYGAAQVEYRKVFNRMIGMVFFAGTGEVASTLNQFSIQGLKPNAGVGFRLKMDRSERLNLRMDLGFGKSTSNFYLSVAEAF